VCRPGLALIAKDAIESQGRLLRRGQAKHIRIKHFMVPFALWQSVPLVVIDDKKRGIAKTRTHIEVKDARYCLPLSLYQFIGHRYAPFFFLSVFAHSPCPAHATKE
jgi:hypothetical protein